MDDLCKKYKQQVDKWKQRATGLDDDRRFLENQIKSAKKQNKALRSAVEQSVNQSRMPTATWDRTGEEQVNEDDMEDENMDGTPEPLSKEATQRYLQTIKSLQNQVVAEKRQIARLRDSRKLIGGAGHLETYFVECINQIKQEIFERRQKGLYGDPLCSPSLTKIANAGQGNNASAYAQTTLHLQDVQDVTMEIFTTADRRRVIELLFQDRDIQSLIQHKVLPKKIRAVQHQDSEVAKPI